MKQKSYFMLAVAAALLTACSSNDLSESPATAPQLDDSAVNFGAYVNRGVTRAGAAGTLTNEVLQNAQVGFGVFAYYSDSESYSETSKPNFMYNQNVAYNGTQWTYSPLKYWPNEYGKNATSEGQDRLTFFAYAPYVNVNPSTGRVGKEDNPTSGIVGMTSNTASGDPYIKYYADMNPDKRVDLCWGVAKEDFTATVDEEAINEVAAGEPYIDVVKPTTGSLINFDFKHALAAVNVQIDTDIDFERVNGQDDPANAANVDAFTRIWVRSITFEGFTDKGRLNLNSRATAGEGPQWFDLTNDSPVASGCVTIYDGRTDGKEGRENAIAKKETPATLNCKIVQNNPYDKDALDAALVVVSTDPGTQAPTGVTKDLVNLFEAQNLTDPIYVIPTDEELNVTIVYDVETYDPNLATFLSDGAVRGSSVQNTIEKKITFENGTISKLEAGKVYTINLHLGLTSVKFDASVTDWPETMGTDIDLPYNYDPNDPSHFYTEEEAAEYNSQLPDAVEVGDEKPHYSETEINAHNATLDIWDETTIRQDAVFAFNSYVTGNPASTWGTGTVRVVGQADGKTTVEVLTNSNYPEQVGQQYVVNAANLTGGASFELYTTENVATGISVDVFEVYSFDAYMDADPTTLYHGTVKVIAQTATTTTVEVVTNDVAGFVGHQYVVNAVDLTDGNTFALFELNGDATGLSVKNVASLSRYSVTEIEEHNNALDVWDENTPRTITGDPSDYFTQEEADAYNATLPGAVSAGDLKPQN